MIVLSLFDGMSCGQIALERAGVPVTAYLASEVDKHAIAVAKDNYPGTVHLGSVTELRAQDLSEVDLLIGGSPCQGFSFAGKQRGSATACGIEVVSLEQYLELKAGGFEFDGQSYLFWEYIRILREVKPKYFLLENVRLTKKWEKMFNEAVGLDPVVINSALVSAQNRVRYYWTNIPGVEQPEDLGIKLKDILEDSSEKIAALHGRYIVQDHKLKTAGLTTQRLEVRKDEKSNCLTTVQKDNVVIRPCEGREPSLESLVIPPNFKKRVEESTDVAKGFTKIDPEKACTMTARQYANWKGNLTAVDGGYRKLSPIECERLQTVPDGYTSAASNTQRYKMLGNGWTVDVIAHIFKGLK